MKFALVFLFGLVVFSHQQFYQQEERDRVLWLLPYYSPQPSFDYQPANYHPSEKDRTALFLNHLTHSSSIPIYKQDNKPHFNTLKNGFAVNDEQLAVQARNKLTNRFRASFLQQPKPQYTPRVVINLATRTNFLNLGKTVVFTVTSSVTFTKVQSCIPTSEFSFGGAGVTCRKRRELVEPANDLLEANQFAITPSGIQPVEPTVSLLVPSAQDGQFGNDPSVNYGVISSKDEDVVNEFQSETPMPLGYSRDKRLFFHLVTTSTVISYIFLSTTVTKTVNLLNPFFGGGQLACLPDGYAVCPLSGTFFG